MKYRYGTITNEHGPDYRVRYREDIRYSLIEVKHLMGSTWAPLEVKHYSLITWEEETPRPDQVPKGLGPGYIAWVGVALICLILIIAAA